MKFNLKDKINFKFNINLLKNKKDTQKEEKESFFKEKLPRFTFFRKYDYDINKVIGVKEDKRYIIYQDKHLLRVYRDSIKSQALLSTYIPIEDAIAYSFQVERSVISKIDLDSFVETKVYAEAGIDETEKHIIKYKVIDSLKDEKYLMIETIIVPYGIIESHFDYILEESDYIDYISFPAFAYKTLYAENVLERANDIFIVLMYDKIFLTFYNDGELLSIATINGGLDRVYDTLSKLNIKGFNKDTFVKLLLKKGLKDSKYYQNEKAILDILENEFSSIAYILTEQISRVISRYDIPNIDRIFITSEYGTIVGLDKFLKNLTSIESFAFEFYEKYNLDRLIVDPFLFLGMLEAHHAYKTGEQDFNFTLFYRRPTFFYRPSGRLVLITMGSFFVFGVYPLYLYLNYLNIEKQNKILEEKITKIDRINKNIKSKIDKIKKEKKEVSRLSESYLKDIKVFKHFIKSIYDFKYSYIPKSKELVKMTLLFNKHNVYVDKLNYDTNMFSIDVFAFSEDNIPSLIDDLVKSGFNVDVDKMFLENKRYISTIRIKE